MKITLILGAATLILLSTRTGQTITGLEPAPAPKTATGIASAAQAQAPGWKAPCRDQ
jgi:hypothetical protein